MRYEIPVPFLTQMAERSTWQANGFASFEEAQSWQGRCCGIMSLKMAAEALLPGAVPTAKELIGRGIALGAYIPGKGWVHQKLVELGQSLGLQGAAHRGAQLAEVAAAIEKGRPCILSISPYFSGGQVAETDEIVPKGRIIPKGGHLIPAVGTVRQGKDLTALIVHHISIHPEWNKPSWQVGPEAIAASFAGNYMEFWL